VDSIAIRMSLFRIAKLGIIIIKCRSVAKSVGCFQRRLFVCVFLNTITSKRVNI